MLVLSRYESEQVVIGKAGDVLTGPITVTFIETRNSNGRVHARLGFDAQKNISVHREEVLIAMGANIGDPEHAAAQVLLAVKEVQRNQPN